MRTVAELNQSLELGGTMKNAKRILVGLKSLEGAVELTELACRLGARGTSLLLVHVIELPDNTPLDAEVANLEAEAQEIVRTSERAARRLRVMASTLVLRAHSASSALLDELREKKSDLAVLGYHHGRTLGEVIFGTTAQHLATHSPCHVVLSIPARQ
jgi:nucleotide-binding universal stress UspA family protein